MEPVVLEPNAIAGRNIGRMGRASRVRRGLVVFGITLALAAALSRFGAPHAAYLALFVPFFAATWSMGQGLQGTCGVLALRGMRDTDDGPEKIMSADEAASVRTASLRTLVVAAAMAAGLTALLFFTR